MKIQAKNEKVNFNPITIEITIESAQELNAIKALTNCSTASIKDATDKSGNDNGQYGILKTSDFNWVADIWIELDELGQ